MIRKFQAAFWSTFPSAAGRSAVDSASRAPRIRGEARPHARILFAFGVVVGLTLLTHLLLAASPAVTPASAADDACPNAEFRSGPSARLADCRAYEQVSPVEKNGGAVTLTAFGPPNVAASPSQLWKSSADGEAVAYLSQTAFADSPSSMPLNPYLARRDASESRWSTVSIGAPSNASNQNTTNLLSYNRYFDLSPDLSRGIFSHLAPNGPLLAPGGVLGYPNLYRRDFRDGEATALTTATPPGFPPQLILATYRPTFRAASDDYSHVIFAAADRLTPDAPSTCFNTSSTGDGCLYEWADGQLRLVSILPDETPSAVGDGGGPGGIGGRNLDHAVSADGSKIYWTAATGTSLGDIYVRIDGDRTEPVGSGRFLAASPDGEQALYLDADGHLLKFDLSTGVSTDLFPGQGDIGFVGASDDLSYVYMTASGGLYLHRDGTNHFIVNPGGTGTGRPIDGSSPTQRDSYVTPDGRHLAFASNSSLTGYDNTPAEPSDCIFNGTTTPCPQVFHYDAGSDRISCASCNPSGERPRGSSVIQPHYDERYAPRVLSDDGGRLFFNSSDALVAGDTNDQQDVYEWRPSGVGDCTAPAGCISLISGGAGGVPDPEDAQSPRNFFVDASADGKNVFFTSQERLVPSDVSADADLYVARIGGGLESQHQAAPRPCSGEECQGEGSAPPPGAAIGSTGESAGNPIPPPSDCNAQRRDADKFARKAKQTKKKARKASGRKGKRLARKAKQAKRKSKRAKRQLRVCRSAR